MNQNQKSNKSYIIIAFFLFIVIVTFTVLYFIYYHPTTPTTTTPTTTPTTTTPTTPTTTTPTTPTTPTTTTPTTTTTTTTTPDTPTPTPTPTTDCINNKDCGTGNYCYNNKVCLPCGIGNDAQCSTSSGCSCATGYTCKNDKCSCEPNCINKCGVSDSCGGLCTCTSLQTCSIDNICVNNNSPVCNINTKTPYIMILITDSHTYLVIKCNRDNYTFPSCIIRNPITFDTSGNYISANIIITSSYSICPILFVENTFSTTTTINSTDNYMVTSGNIKHKDPTSVEDLLFIRVGGNKRCVFDNLTDTTLKVNISKIDCNIQLKSENDDIFNILENNMNNTTPDTYISSRLLTSNLSSIFSLYPILLCYKEKPKKVVMSEHKYTGNIFTTHQADILTKNTHINGISITLSTYSTVSGGDIQIYMQKGAWGKWESGIDVGNFPVIRDAFIKDKLNSVNLHMSCNIILLKDTYFCIRVTNINSDIVYGSQLVIY